MMRNQNALDVFFKPKSVAVIGATERAGHVGRAILWNLISSPFGGAVYPVNPERNAVLGTRACPSISAVPERVELAAIVAPAESVPQVIETTTGLNIGRGFITFGMFPATRPLNWSNLF